MMNYLFTFFALIFSTLLFSQNPPLQIPFGDLSARNIGPAVMSGRVTDIDGVHQNPKILYVASASGGLWKSNSGGSSFRPVFDEHTMSIGHVAIDQNHPDTVWVGTGEPWVRNSVSVGSGIYVSTNGGNTWTFKGLENSERISNILIDPTNSAVIYAAVQGQLWDANEERGLYKSTDFGNTWEKILYMDENTGCADLSMDPNNPNILYAAMWDHRRYPDFFQSGGPGSGLYKTTDGGQTWTKLTNDLPEGTLGRMAVAVAPSNPDRIYLTVECEKQEEKGLYRSEDGGESWAFVNNDFNITVRPFYFSRLVVDPTNEDKIFKCGLNLTISEDGGKSFRTVGSGVHSDIHAVWVCETEPERIVIGTDGGAYRALDGGYEFEMFMDLPISQFYQVSVDDDKPFNVYGGLQDNGSWYGPSSSPGGVENKDWELSHWGDGFYSFRHPTDPNIVYSESQGGNIVRVNLSDGQKKDIKPVAGEDEEEYRFNWNAPIHVSPNNPERLYFAAQYLFKTEDRGESWERISPDLTTNDPKRQRQKESGGLSIDNSTAENNATIYAIAESPVDEQIIWVGTDDGHVQVTTDGGATWTNVVANMPGLPEGLWVSSVEPSRHDANTCYVTVDGHRSGDKTPYLFKTTDLGNSWISLLTEEVEGYAHDILEDPESPQILYLGTEFGLFITLDGGISWKRFSNNLPKVSVRRMAIQEREHALVLGTHGRGIYIIDNIDLLRQLTPAIADQTLHFLDAGPAVIRLQQQGRPFGGAGTFSGRNPDEAATIAYYMKKRHTFGRMALAIYDEAGILVKEVPAGKSAGLNIVSIPIRLDMPKAAPTQNRSALIGSIIPPSLPEGNYTVKVKKGREEFSTDMALIFDPEHADTYPAADRKEAHAVQMVLYQLTNQLGYIYYTLEDMHQQAKERLEQAEGKRLKVSLEGFEEEVRAYKGSLVSLEGDFYVDEGSNIREEISTLFLGISQYPGKPTAAQLKKLEQVSERMEKVEAKFNGFNNRREQLNELLEKADLEQIEIKTFDQYMNE